MDADKTATELLTAFTLDRIAERPVSEQIALYRAVAILAADRTLSGECFDFAERLEALDRAQMQLVLDFRARAAREHK